MVIKVLGKGNKERICSITSDHLLLKISALIADRKPTDPLFAASKRSRRMSVASLRADVKKLAAKVTSESPEFGLLRFRERETLTKERINVGY
jgi:site-specific recombinase XerD